jgi:hypothetical protein
MSQQLLEIALSQIPSVVKHLQDTGKDSSFAVLCFPSPCAQESENGFINIQFAIQGGLLGLEWVLIGEENIEDRQRVVKFIEGEGYTVTERELNQVPYLRVEVGDLTTLCTRIITQCYGYTSDSNVQLGVHCFQWQGVYREWKASITAWDEDIQSSPAITLESIDHFNARGMKNVYGRSDRFGNPPTFNLEIWKTRDGRLLARFWSHGYEVNNESHEVIGYRNVDFPRSDERWVPEVLRCTYDNWIEANW